MCVCVQSPSPVRLFATPCAVAPGPPVPHRLPQFAQVHVHWINDAIQPSHPLLPTSPWAFNLSQRQDLLQWVSCLHQVAKVLSFSFSISPSNEYSGLIFFRIDSFDLRAVQACCPRDSKGLARVFSSITIQVWILRHSDFFMVQLSHPYTTTGKTIAYTYSFHFFLRCSVCPTLCDHTKSQSYTVHGIQGQNTGVGNLSLLQGIFPTQGLNPGLLHCKQILYQLSHAGSPRILEWVAYPFASGSSWPRNWTGVFCIAGRFFNRVRKEKVKWEYHSKKSCQQFTF